MKKVLFISTMWFIFTINVPAQESNNVIFTLHEKPNSSYSISIQEPLDGMYNDKVATFQQTITDSSNVMYIYKKKYPAIIPISINNGRKYNIIMSPDNSVYINIYPQISNNDSIVFSGDNAAGQKLFNAKPIGIWFEEIQKIFIDNLKNSPSIYGLIKNYVDVALHPIDSLKNCNEISNSFAGELKKSMLVMMYSMATMNYSYDVFSHFKEDGKLTATDTIAIQDSREKIYNSLPPLDSNILAYGFWGYRYIIDYLNFTYQNVSTSDHRYLPEFDKLGIYGFLPDKIQKPVLGNAIINRYTFNTGEFDKDKATAFFRKKYPESEYLPIIDKITSNYYTQTPEIHRKKDNNTTSASGKSLSSNKKITDITPYEEGIHIDTSAVASNIKTLNELYANYFKGKKIFIDLWATWCMPCRKEFAYKETLDSLLRIHNIIPVLLSLDQPNFKGQWVRFININKINGYHFLINEALTNDIRSIAGYPGPLSAMPIPHYIYMDEYGNIVEKNAPRPSEIEKLVELFNKK